MGVRSGSYDASGLGTGRAGEGQPSTQIITDPVTNAIVGQTYTYDVDAIDADGDTLDYFVPVAPPGMTINQVSGIVSWVPTANQIGDHPVEVIVEDGEFLEGGLNDFQEFVVTVTDADGGG